MKNELFIVGSLLVGSALIIGGIVWYLDYQTPKTWADIAKNQPAATPLTVKENNIMQPGITNEANPIAVLDTNQGVIKIELFKDTMPITAGNFEKLIKEGFYDGIKFHRVIDGFMIQGGDPNSKTDNKDTYGTGGPGYTIKDEFVAGPYLTNVRGTISMANAGPESGGSQFFINLEDNEALDYDKLPQTSKHPVFGRVIEGMDVVDKIGRVATDARDLPLDPVVITKAAVIEGEGE